MAHSVQSMDQEMERFHQIEDMRIKGKTKIERFYPTCLILIQGHWYLVQKDGIMIKRINMLHESHQMNGPIMMQSGSNQQRH
eukprot:9173853-Ditylum_brightwellii.AAC.1